LLHLYEKQLRSIFIFATQTACYYYSTLLTKKLKETKQMLKKNSTKMDDRPFL